MSDEQDSPALSLRPRKKPADDDAAADSSATAAEKPKLSLKPKSEPLEATSLPTDTAEEAPPALSLKPKSAEPEVPPTEVPAPETPAVEVVKPRTKPKLSIKLDGEEKKEPAAESPAESTPRLKPKLSIGTDSASITSPEPEPPVGEASSTEAAAKQPPPAEHSDETNPALDPAVLEALQKVKTEKPKLKLSISKPAEVKPTEEKSEDSEKSTPVTDFPPPPGAKKGANLPPPVPVVTDESGQSATAPPIPMPVDEEDDDSEAPVRKRLRPEQRPIFKLIVIIIGITLIGAIGAGGYMVYNIMFGEPDVIIEPIPTPPPVIATPADPAAEPDGPLSTAGKLIQKAQDAAVSHDEVTDAVNTALDDQGASAEVPVPATPQVTFDNTPENPAPAVEVLPSQNFQAWVSSAVISGVREGSKPRAFINSILVEQGDTVNAQFGITFDRVDAERNLVIFKDRTGAIVGKRY